MIIINSYRFGSFDVDAGLVIDKMTAAGATPTNPFQQVINTLIKNLKGTGGLYGTQNLYAIQDYFAPHAALEDVQALTAWKGNNPVKVNSPTFVAKSGWLPNATGGHTLWSGFTPSVDGVNYKQNDCSFGVWVGASPGAAYFMSAFGLHKVGLRTVTSNNDQYCNTATFSLGHFSTTTEGLCWINRASSGTFKTIKDTTVISTLSQASSGLSDWKLALAGAANTATTINNIPTLTNPIKLSFAGAGMEAHASQWRNSINQYISEVAAL